MTQDGLKAKELQRLLKPLVAAIVKEVAPVKDEITANEAVTNFICTRRWLDEKTLNGDLTPRYVGKSKIYSRADIEALKATESTPVMIVTPRRGRPKGSGNKKGGTAKITVSNPVKIDTSDIIPL